MKGKINVVADALSRLSNGVEVFANETLELHSFSKVMMSSVGCECVD